MTTEQYPSYIGAMRVNVVKANPKQKEIAKTSFFSCVANSDWEHAQQVQFQPVAPLYPFRLTPLADCCNHG